MKAEVKEAVTGGERQVWFELGRKLITPGAAEALIESGRDASEFLDRHQHGDWGDMSEDDKRENDFSVDKELRILSAYYLNDKIKVWVITEADRSATTVLLPGEY